MEDHTKHVCLAIKKNINISPIPLWFSHAIPSTKICHGVLTSHLMLLTIADDVIFTNVLNACQI